MMLFSNDNYFISVFKVVLEAVRGSGVKGDIAVDDIKIYTGKCQPSGLCKYETYYCHNCEVNY